MGGFFWRRSCRRMPSPRRRASGLDQRRRRQAVRRDPARGDDVAGGPDRGRHAPSRPAAGPVPRHHGGTGGPPGARPRPRRDAGGAGGPSPRRRRPGLLAARAMAASQPQRISTTGADATLFFRTQVRPDDPVPAEPRARVRAAEVQPASHDKPILAQWHEPPCWSARLRPSAGLHRTTPGGYPPLSGRRSIRSHPEQGAMAQGHKPTC